jgi:hypothetical protein
MDNCAQAFFPAALAISVLRLKMVLLSGNNDVSLFVDQGNAGVLAHWTQDVVVKARYRFRL